MAGHSDPAENPHECDKEGEFMKLVVEILLAIFLHPIAWVLCVINIVGRTDMSGLKKVLWVIITFVWGIGPILYILLGDGTFW
jgi:Phospholipase_D-nuclease N-terminal